MSWVVEIGDEFAPEVDARPMTASTRIWGG
jgi:hypothetical protein